MSSSIQRLHCEQIPNIPIIRLGSEPTVYVAHMQNIIGQLLGKLSVKSANHAMHAFMKNEGSLMQQGGDLTTAYVTGTLTAKIYTHQLGTDPRMLSNFVTMEGVKDVINLVSKQPNKDSLLALFRPDVLASRCVVISEKPIDFGSLSKKRRIMASNEEGVYVLRFSDGVKPLFYVGKSGDIEKRIQQHANGQGAACVTGRDFIRVPCLVPATTDIESWERGEVLERMYQFGIDAVRGWKYTLRIMPLAQKLSAFDDVCERFDLCRRCGRGSHFIRECETLTTDRWTNGLEVRSFYQNTSTNEELNRLESQVQQERTARMEAERKNADAVRILLAGPCASTMEPM